MKKSISANLIIIVSLIYILAILVGFFIGANYYLASQYQTSLIQIKQNLDSTGITVRHEVGEPEIAKHSEWVLAEIISERNSEKINYYLYNLIRTELIILAVSLFVAAGFTLIDLTKFKKEAGH